MAEFLFAAAAVVLVTVALGLVRVLRGPLDALFQNIRDRQRGEEQGGAEHERESDCQGTHGSNQCGDNWSDSS